MTSKRPASKSKRYRIVFSGAVLFLLNARNANAMHI